MGEFILKSLIAGFAFWITGVIIWAIGSAISWLFDRRRPEDLEWEKIIKRQNKK